MMKPSGCSGCPLEHRGKGFVRATGDGTSGVMIVGEAPGHEEAYAGEPFIGAAGYFLDHRVLYRAGLERSLFRVDNILHCQPPANKLSHTDYEFPAIRQCKPYLDAEIERFKPKVIIALGGVALQQLTGCTGIQRHRGYILQSTYGIPVIATYHPAYLMPRRDRLEGGADENPWRLIGAAILDIKKALRLAAGTLPVNPEKRYILDPGVAAWDSWVRETLARPAGVPLSFDIETPGKLTAKDEGELERPGVVPIVRIGFSWAEGTAISIPWRGEYMDGIRALLAQGTLLGWNCYGFDEPLLRAHEIGISPDIHDGMWAWHVLQSDLPKGLEFVGGFYADGLLPWKHLGGSEPALYNAQDNDVALRNFNGIRADLEAYNQWEYYLNHVKNLWPILRRAGENGVPIDLDASNALESHLESRIAEIDLLIPTLVPPECRDTRVLKIYPRPEALEGRELEEITITDLIRTCERCGEQGITKGSHQKGGKKNPCNGATVVKREGKRKAWLERFPFNPGSRDDIERYIRHFKHPMGKNATSGAETVDKKLLRTLAAKYPDHPLYALMLERRKLAKAKSTYVYKPDAQGLIHTSYTFAPSTGRLSSRNYNLTNVAHGDENPFAERIRRQIIPPPGMVFVEADSSAIESVISGVFMGDPDFVALAKRGIYDYVCTFEHELEFTPDNVSALKDRLGADAYKRMRDRNKRTALGTFYGMTARMLWQTYPEVFPTIKSAQEAIDLLGRACPALPAWHHSVRMQAHQQSYLENPWNGRHWFYHVFGKHHKTGKVTLGEDGKRCVAFLPQSSAAEFLKENTLAIASLWPLEWLPANLLVHDAYCILAPEARAQEAVDLLVNQLTRSIPQLGGITIGCEVKIGTNWADMVSVRKVA